MMRAQGIVRVLTALVLGGTSQALAQDVGVALVTAVSGEAMVRSGRKARAAQVLEWLAVGARVETRGAGRLRLVLRNGRRYELAGAARAVVGRDALRSTSGARELAWLPAWPAELLAPSAGSGTSAAAVRIRGGDLAVVSPRAGGFVLADQALEVRFTRPAGATQCEVEIQGRDGSPIGHRVQADDDRVLVPGGLLEDGEKYECVLLCRRGAAPAARGEASFQTLSSESARRARELLAAAGQAGDPDAALAGAALARELGRAAQAREGLLEALARQPDDASLQAATARAAAWR